jgi:ABC-type spermidine/putrescine transport system permease subunit II
MQTGSQNRQKSQLTNSPILVETVQMEVFCAAVVFLAMFFPFCILVSVSFDSSELYKKLYGGYFGA